MAMVESSNEVQLLTTAGGNLTTASSDRIPLSSFTPDDPLSAFFAVAIAHPRAKESEALFVNLHHFQNRPITSAGVQKLHDKLAWCEWGIGPGKEYNGKAATSLTSTSHCYKNGVAGTQVKS